jgi:hypothetical protein
MKKNDPILSVVEAKRALLSGALKAFVGVHESKKLKHLGISEEKLKEAGSSDDTPASFWVHDVPSDCLLRQVGIRVMSAKPSSTAVERLWNSFGDNLTAKRRSLLNETLQMFVYTKMNHWLLQLDGVDASIEQQEYSFQSVLEFVDEMIESELAVEVVETPAVQDDDLPASMSDGGCTDDVEDW